MSLPEWKDYEKFIASLAWKSHRRAMGQGLNVDYEDIFQEASVAFCRARLSFNPNLGFKFTTYCGRAVLTALARYFDMMNRQLVGKTTSLDTMLSDEEGDAHDLFEGNAPNPVTQLQLEEELERAVQALGPLGAQMIEWMMNPPPEVQREVEALQWKIERMVQMGMRPNRQTVSVDTRFLLGELLPKIFPKTPVQVRELRQRVQSVVDAWQI